MAACTIVLFLLAILARSVDASEQQTFEKPEKPNFRAGKSVFNYTDLEDAGPSKWGTISPDFEFCAVGQHQSPINLQINSTTSEGLMPEVILNEAVVSYAPSGGNFVLNCDAGLGQAHCSTIKYYNSDYHMLQAHFHSPSEHRLEGKEFPLEIHFVHQSENKDALLVLGVFFELSEVVNEQVDALLNAALDRGRAVVDFPAFVQPGAALCTYEGSLTTPPCTEGVHWLLSNATLPVTLKQVGQYREMVGEKKNARPIQGDTAAAHPEARCYADPSFTGGIARKPGDTHGGPVPQSGEVNSTGGHSTGPHGTSTDTGTAHGNGTGTSPVNEQPASTSTDAGIAGSNFTGVLAPPAKTGSGGSCFPARATVQLSNGKVVTMAELQIGDEVSVGQGRYSRVYLFSHRDESAVTDHVQVTLSSGSSLAISPGHYLRVNGVLSEASSIVVGDTLETVQSQDVVVGVTSVRAQGLYNPHTVSGDIAVDGVITSTYTRAVPVGAAQALLAPFRTLFRAGAVTEGSAGSFLKYGAEQLVL